MTLLDQFAGRILDTDTHEFTPARLWPEMFGEASAPFAAYFMHEHSPEAVNSLTAPVDDDEGEVTPEVMQASWRNGASAAGAFNMTRRLQVMDLNGVEQTFVLPTGPAVLGFLFISLTPDRLEQLIQIRLTVDQMDAVAGGLLDGYNDWCIDIAKISPRLRPVAYVDSRDLKAAIADVERLASAGIRAIGLAHGVPPGGRSPGHPDVDPLWEVFSANDIPISFHVGGDYGFLQSNVWADYGFSNPWGMKRTVESPEAALDPYTWSAVHLGAQNFMTLMVFGGAFDRNPELRFSCSETSAYWVGPTAENVKNVGDQFRSCTSKLSLTPAEYFQKHVRVSPFWWEPIDEYIERFPWLENVLVYGSDYPHYEGGRNPADLFAAKLERLGERVMEKFFVKNAALVMP